MSSNVKLFACLLALVFALLTGCSTPLPRSDLGRPLPEYGVTVRSVKSLRPSYEGLLLLSAIDRGDTRAALALLKQGVNPNCADALGRTALMYSAITGQVRVVMKALLEQGAEVNRAAADGTTALIAAAVFGSPEGVQMLLEHGARFDARDAEGRTALDWARMRLPTAPSDRSLLPNLPVRNVYGDLNFSTKAEVLAVISLLENASAR